MIRTILTLEVDVARAEETIERYAALEIFETSIRESGAISCELLQDVSDPGKLIALALWENESAYAHWLANPSRTRISAELVDLTPVASGSVYLVRSEVGGPSLDRRF